MDFRDNNKWLENLEVGDYVIYGFAGYKNESKVAKVERFTKTLIIVEGSKFNRNSGFSTGGGYNRPTLNEATPETIEKVNKEVRLRNYKNAFRNFDITEASVEAQKEIYDIIKKERERIRNDKTSRSES